VLTIDFETYYDRDFSLSKISTEEYIRDPRFETIGVAVKVDDEETQSFSGSRADTKRWLEQFDWAASAACAHNAVFDAAILAWHFDLYPKVWLDTMSMAQALLGTKHKVGLAPLAEYFQLGTKGTEVVNALGKTRKSFTPAEMERYMAYCRNDVDLTYDLYQRLYNFRAHDELKYEPFPIEELKLIDLTIRMFIQPTLRVDVPLLEEHLLKIREDKLELLTLSGLDKDTIMSNNKFAEALMSVGVAPPKKFSPTTGKETWAFSKTDEAFKDLMEHPDLRVQTMVSARLGVKTTIEETRTERFIDIGKRGALPVPLKYYAAHTGRWGGSDKLNMQNLPSRDNDSKIKQSLLAPDGHVVISCDSSQIEARTLAWLAGQDDLVEAFANKEDVYKIMASKIYRTPVEEITKAQRFFGKTVILGCGYGMGAAKFHNMLSLNPQTSIDVQEATRIVNVYRTSNKKIVKLWDAGSKALMDMAGHSGGRLGRDGLIEIGPDCLILPNTMRLDYLNLRLSGPDRDEYVYTTLREKEIRIYGGKLVENIVQALARIVVGSQMVRISKRYRPVLTVHDAVTIVVPENESDEAMAYVQECMRWTPKWATGLPVDCEIGCGPTYADS
jgi:DNA polymerase I-like protein with 3'-5' exonuclease and polymerase domains